ncbi:hypothetical protein E3N88_23350 [Mikania micrantha]|uniref:Reverse transcriptase Ty1/copia-type domain-containing protein n=1 Tax=Mikania micrantha TaxID=192012 RepID=A0A5N6NE63_9ASTR|nr:hypothetical protein E3N88_23350 [Mikania micrantha]
MMVRMQLDRAEFARRQSDRRKDSRGQENYKWTSFVVQGPAETEKGGQESQQGILEDYEPSETGSDWSSPSSTVKERGPMLPRETEDQDQPHDPSIAPEETYDDTPVRGMKALDDLDDVDLMLVDEDPKNYLEAKTVKEWQEAMEAEMTSIERNQTWSLTDLPAGVKPIGLKWVYKTKKDAQGRITKHKARLVAKGYVQQYGVDYEEVFALVTRMETIRLLLAVAAQQGWHVHHLDVKTTFLHGELKEQVFVNQPDGFVKKGAEDKCKQEPAVYIRGKGQNTLIMGVYVDDLLITGAGIEEIRRIKKEMEVNFEMTDLGMLTYYLGIEVKQDKEGISICQEGYAKKILKETSMSNCNATTLPMEPGQKLSKEDKSPSVDPTLYRKWVGCLRYLTHTRPDLSYSVGYVSRFMQEPKQTHMQAVKQILRYVKGTTNLGIWYKKNGSKTLHGFSDSSHSVDRDDGRSTTGQVFFYNEAPVSWSSQKQATVALSSCEAEFMAATSAACQAIWLQRLLSELLGVKEEAVTIEVDNQSALALMRNPVFLGRSKHIDTRYHFIRECVENGKIKVKHVSGAEQKADVLTKALPRLNMKK